MEDLTRREHAQGSPRHGRCKLLELGVTAATGDAWVRVHSVEISAAGIQCRSPLVDEGAAVGLVGDEGGDEHGAVVVAVPHRAVEVVDEDLHAWWEDTQRLLCCSHSCADQR